MQGGDVDRVGTAAESAARWRVLKAITVRPSVLQLQKVQLVGDRIYLLFLVADADGEEMLKGVYPGGEWT